jgi:AraC family transcriptional regulator of adaptative response/methylated-DNA-[protein]-cysteine methyltransferase
MNDLNMTPQTHIIANAIDWLVTQDTAPSLNDIAARYDYDPAHFQKLFKSHVGVSPKQFTQYMYYKRARDLLLGGYSTLDAAYKSGLSGQGRLHDLFLSIEGMTPGSVKGRGADITITYGFADTFMGELMVAKTDKGICWLGFQVDESRDRSTQRMFNYWPNAKFIEGNVGGEIKAIDHIWRGENKHLKLHLYGTSMQIQVWQALLKIPFGAVTDYKAIAHYIGKPKAARVVGNAVGMNPISLLIPCHRVIQSTGIVNNYGWGSPRKKIILGLEGKNNIID